MIASSSLPAGTSVEIPGGMGARFSVRDYDLTATLTSGQVFRWQRRGDAWEGVVGGRWVRLRSDRNGLEAATVVPQTDWTWLTRYLRLDDDLPAILASFPQDEPLRAAVAYCPGLRLLRQEPWECLASFILSSTKQIVQIQQCAARLCERFGEPIPAPAEAGRQFAFPTAVRLAQATETELRECRIGFRAKYLRAAAGLVAAGALNLAALPAVPLAEAREQLMRCPGVGRKIADCVLLFACGFETAFPIDVWIERALQSLYFHRRRPTRKRLEHFAATYFGPYAGFAQQFLFHHLRTNRAPTFPQIAGSGRKSRFKPAAGAAPATGHASAAPARRSQTR